MELDELQRQLDQCGTELAAAGSIADTLEEITHDLEGLPAGELPGIWGQRQKQLVALHPGEATGWANELGQMVVELAEDRADLRAMQLRLYELAGAALQMYADMEDWRAWSNTTWIGLVREFLDLVQRNADALRVLGSILGGIRRRLRRQGLPA